MTDSDQPGRGSRDTRMSRLRPQPRVLKVVLAGLAIVVVVWLVFAYVFARSSGIPIAGVMKDLGELQPFTAEVPGGSVVLSHGDTVGVLSEVATLRASDATQKLLRLYKGRWTGGAAEMHGDSALVGIISASELVGDPVVITLVREPRDPRASVGQLLLEPGARPIALFE